MKVFVLVVFVPAFLEGEYTEVIGVYKTHEAAEERGKKAVAGYVLGSGVWFEVTECEVTL